MGKYSTEGNADYRQSSGYRHGNNDEKICGDCIKLDTSEPIFKNNEINTTVWIKPENTSK